MGRSRGRSGGEATTPTACFALYVGCLLVEGRSLAGRDSSCVGTVGGHRSAVTPNNGEGSKITRRRQYNNIWEGCTIIMGKAAH